ncbi:hypothetical protein HanIR_Chr15g0761611 [Helianthus annuus]|nr:hypothetical protein HanIR_Chr15g0761611 [Helianthus annuus]
MLKHWVRSSYQLKGHGRLGINELHIKICIVSECRVNWVYWVNHRLIQVDELYLLVWVESWGKDRIGILLNIVVVSNARSRGYRGCSIWV